MADKQLYVCVPADMETAFTDNLFGVCEGDGCGAPIQYRPHAPSNMKKICQECAIKHIKEAESNNEPVVFAVTQKVLDDVKEHLNATKH